MKIWDTFPFGGPGALDMLELRLRTLDPYVDYWAITEATWDHQGGKKELDLLQNQDRFAPWLERIRYIPMIRDPGDGVPDDPFVRENASPDDTWVRENAQRDPLMWGVRGIQDGDVILHGDLDEIPDLAAWDLRADHAVFLHNHFIFAVDWQDPELTWAGTIAARWGSFGSFSWLRRQRLTGLPVAGGGWHFSWLGGPERIAAKGRQTAHAEIRDHMQADARRSYELGWIPWEGRCALPVEVDGTWPDWIARRECPASWFRPRQELYTPGQEPPSERGMRPSDGGSVIHPRSGGGLPPTGRQRSCLTFKSVFTCS